MMRFASAAAACVLSACAMPLADERAPFCTALRSELRLDSRGDPSSDARDRAARHAQLSLAYLRHARADVARTEAMAAWRLVPDDVGILHLLALSEAALGHSEAALFFFAQAAALNDVRDEADNAAIHAADAAMFAGGKADINRALQDRVREQSLTAAQGALKELSDSAILWSNYAVALEAVGQSERAACFSERSGRSRGGVDTGRPCVE